MITRELRNEHTRGPLYLDDDEIIVDCFAGGGGASLGVEEATGRSVTIAINHDPDAVAMHAVNHPQTEHYIENISDVDPVAVCQGRRVGLMWASPDCTDHSRAKNGAIVRSKKIRALSWIVVDWAKAVRPRIILLENVQEWWDWGPLDEAGKIDKARKGEYRAFWWRRLEAMGYRLSMRVLKACDFGAPTSRQRLFIIARCDGVDPESCWPEPTHGPGRAHPYRTAAECIDYSLPCPSIFMTKRQAKKFTKETGIKIKRPLADKTMQRIRRGIYKYVLNAAKPFTVRLTGDDHRVYDIAQPARTVTAANRGEVALVQPILTSYYGDSKTGGNDRSSTVDEPLPTQTTANRFAVIAPTLVQTGYGERKGQAPRCLDLHAPLGTIIAGGAGNGNGKHALVAAFLTKGYSEPGNGNKKFRGGWNGGQDLRAPIGTVTAHDHHSLTVSSLVKMKGTSDAHMDASSPAITAPLSTIAANGNHHGEVRAFLQRYNGTGEGQSLAEPMLTVTTKERFGLVVIEGEVYQIADIGMRMLTPRELFRAQGFPDTYIIDPIVTRTLKHGRTVTGPLTETSQVEKCGNSVCPPIARAIISAVLARPALALAA